MWLRWHHDTGVVPRTATRMRPANAKDRSHAGGQGTKSKSIAQSTTQGTRTRCGAKINRDGLQETGRTIADSLACLFGHREKRRIQLIMHDCWRRRSIRKRRMEGRTQGRRYRPVERRGAGRLRAPVLDARLGKTGVDGSPGQNDDEEAQQLPATCPAARLPGCPQLEPR